MLAFLAHRWFLIGLVAVLVAGILWPVAMAPVARWFPGDVILATVTFVMALPLETGALWRAVRQPGPAWLAVGINSGLAPPLGWLASLVLTKELGVGLILSTTVPSTLSSAAVWTRRAGGNDAIAFLVTMITNLSCFIVIPAWLAMLVGIHTDIGFGNIVWTLVLYVVVPIVVAQLLRQWRMVGGWATRHKNALSTLAQIGVLMMVFVGAVECGNRLAVADAAVTSLDIVVLIAAVVFVHLALLLLGFAFSRALRFSREDGIGVAISGSQKTLMVGAYLAMAVGPLAILPMVAYHATQLVIDTLVADWLRQRKEVAELDPEL
jgi:sodium/bile acid cotransporter 7